MIAVEWLLIALIVLTIVVNIRSFMVLAQFKRQRKQMAEDTAILHQNMEEFVASIEVENDELYSKLADTIKENEKRLEERIRRLEDQKANPVPIEPTELTEPSPPAESAVIETELQPPAEQEPEEELQDIAKIEQLHKQGFSAQQIAKVVEAKRGEVELVINMFKKKQSYQK